MGRGPWRSLAMALAEPASWGGVHSKPCRPWCGPRAATIGSDAQSTGVINRARAAWRCPSAVRRCARHSHRPARGPCAGNQWATAPVVRGTGALPGGRGAGARSSAWPPPAAASNPVYAPRASVLPDEAEAGANPRACEHANRQLGRPTRQLLRPTQQCRHPHSWPRPPRPPGPPPPPPPPVSPRPRRPRRRRAVAGQRRPRQPRPRRRRGRPRPRRRRSGGRSQRAVWGSTWTCRACGRP